MVVNDIIEPELSTTMLNDIVENYKQCESSPTLFNNRELARTFSPAMQIFLCSLTVKTINFLRNDNLNSILF